MSGTVATAPPLFAALVMLAACETPERPGNWPRPEQPVATPEGLVDASDPQPISDLAWRYGEASWDKDAQGDPLIRADMGGVPYRIEFYGCEGGRHCTDLRLVADAREDADGAWTVPAIAAWNATRRYGKVSRPEDASARVEMNLVLQGGVTRQNLDASFDWWSAVLAEFAAGPDS